MFMNYMDYVDDDTMVMFTKGQVERMNATLLGPRATLATSQGLIAISTERIAVPDVARTDLSARLLLGDEVGEKPRTYFDGVSWVAVDR